MALKQVPPLTKKQWKFVVDKLDEPASKEHERFLQDIAEKAKKFDINF